MLFALISLRYWSSDSHIGFADGRGYYDYLPSAFIRHDLIRKDWTPEDRSTYKDLDKTVGIYVDSKGKTVNKYPVGTAILQAPFFFGAYFFSELDGNDDGYQPAFQKAVFVAALFYLFLSLLLFKGVLSKIEIGRFWIVVLQIFLLFSTSLSIYTNVEASFSHVYSLFTILLFIVVVQNYFRNPTVRTFVFSCILLGLIMLLRQVNPIVVLFVPFMAGSWDKLRSGVQYVLTKPVYLGLGLLSFILIAAVQCLFWYLQTGSWLLYSYEGESFNFLEPKLFNIWFSYKKGLFVYTPIIFISCLVSFSLLRHSKYLFFSWWLGFLGISYILSSWWAWYYGCSYGNRAFIEFYPLLLLPLAVFFQRVRNWKFLVLPIALLSIPLNFIQTIQYKSYILHWIDMDKEKYWKVFLQTNEVYRGILWRSLIDLGEYNKTNNWNLGDFKMDKNESKFIKPYSTPKENVKSIVSLSFEHQFEKSNQSSIIIGIQGQDTTQFLYWREIPIIHFHVKDLNSYHEGRYDIEIPEIRTKEELRLGVYSNVVGESKPLNNFILRQYQ